MKKMKMRLTGFLAFALLSISILSYGVSGSVFATSDPNPALPISSNLEIYSNGANVEISGNIRDYDMLEEDINRKYSDLSGKATYEFKPGTKIDLLLGYRHQAGPGIDLDLLTVSTEFNTNYRKLYFTLGLSLYLRDYLEEITDYYSAYFEIVRRF